MSWVSGAKKALPPVPWCLWSSLTWHCAWCGFVMIKRDSGNFSPFTRFFRVRVGLACDQKYLISTIKVSCLIEVLELMRIKMQRNCHFYKYFLHDVDYLVSSCMSLCVLHFPSWCSRGGSGWGVCSEDCPECGQPASCPHHHQGTPQELQVRRDCCRCAQLIHTHSLTHLVYSCTTNHQKSITVSFYKIKWEK